MQPTERFYEADAYRTSASSVITAALPLEGGGGRIALAGTVFYPEGGGQPADRGVLTLPGGASLAVTDVHEKEGVIWHRVDRLPPDAAPGVPVDQQIDWAWRFDKMQQHTGEHILSGTLHRLFGAENVGFHIGSEAVRMDTSVPISPEGLRQAETEANRFVWQDLPVRVLYPSPEQLAHMTYRSKKEIAGQVRIVAIPGADTCACCGTHVSSSGQVGLVKLLSCQKFRSGVRIELVCGGRAFAFLSKVWEQNHQISNLTSAKLLETAPAVERLLGENQALKSRILTLEDARFAALAQQYQGAGDVVLFEEDLRPDGLRRLTAAVQAACGGRCACFSGRDGQGYQYAIGQPGGELRPLVKELNQALQGRGGGKPDFVQGSVAAGRAEIEHFFQTHTP